MQTLEALDLYHLPMGDPAMGEDPWPEFEKARQRHPWLARWDEFGYVVHEYAAMRELFRQDDKLRPPYAGIVEELGQVGTPWGRFTQEQMIALPPDQHKLLRTTFAAKFTPRNANQLRPMMRATVARLLDDWAPRGAIDFEEFSSHFPISVMFALVGAPHEGIALLRDDLEAIGLAHSYQLDRFPRIQEGMVRLEKFVEDTIAERRAHPRADGVEDLLELLIRTGDEGEISPRQLTDLIMFFFIAGYDTSKNVLTYTMYTLLDYPEIYARCAEDYDYCRKVIEEALRWFNPGTVARYADEDIAYRGVLIPKDTMLFFPLSVSGRDPVTYPDGDRFDPDRPIEPERRHIAFALGKHMCLGQYIARAQLQEALHQIAQRIREPRLAGPVGWRPFPGTWGLRGLPITFTPGEARVREAEPA
ncbi:cytochrome P450 [Novosphingobium album (ex Liu et al. 2023)]|uniref:Cytochrome P450 n=1 Tax=Novosphingobium album (ex Liu et al. 2023) TaxID=3031130 RepID=A0ABT5WMY3_9SPHN|nr:cytochrome P450 [Novosphingobium album (ex Liu et al. 2023)]MDE8651409.1 cytochrome P450 [Novosphingobium album (ex Liu et al. 2023)]